MRLSLELIETLSSPYLWPDQFNPTADDGGKRARSPGRARRKPLKPLRAGMPGDSGGPVASTPVLFVAQGAAVHRAPGIPHAHDGAAGRFGVIERHLPACMHSRR
jgi:hypothetical protein